MYLYNNDFKDILQKNVVNFSTTFYVERKILRCNSSGFHIYYFIFKCFKKPQQMIILLYTVCSNKY